MHKTLRLLLGDQLNSAHRWFQTTDEDTCYVLMELRQETDYVRHHIQKVLAFFLSMRAFAAELQGRGHKVIYLRLDDPANVQSLTENLDRLIEAYEIDRFEYQLPDEYRLDQQLRAYCASLRIPTQAWDTDHFLTNRDELAAFFGRKTYVMEFFYRKLRRKHQLLMDGDQPATGRWNYDADNRQPLGGDQFVPPPRLYPRDVRELVRMLRNQGVETIGRVDPERFIWPVTRPEYLDLLAWFTGHALPYFGTYQDALSADHWSLFHSRLSFGLNAKLLAPREVIEAAIAAWQTQPDRISFAQLEGFVRQILGWREYMRGVYWAQMPTYAGRNFFDHQAPLPRFYWDGQTRLACLRHAIGQSLDYAYAHHIQRLMVTGNFALLAGVHPDEVDAWYLGVYIDAIEWVEITNTRGMSQFADGGIGGTKPYVSSAAYLHKMGPYCKGCFYDKNRKVGERACPFNSLYWDFHDRHRTKLEGNPRIGMVYKTWDKMRPADRSALLWQAKGYKSGLDEL